MNYPRDLASRLTRDGRLIVISRFNGSGYYEVTKETDGYYRRIIFDTGASAWRYYRHNRSEAN